MIFKPGATISPRQFLKFLFLFYDADKLYWEDEHTLGISQRLNKSQVVFYRNYDIDKTTHILKLYFVNSEEAVACILEFEIKLFAKPQTKFTRYRRSTEPYDYLHSCSDFTIVCKNDIPIQLT